MSKVFINLNFFVLLDTEVSANLSPNPCRTVLKSQKSQKLLDRNLKCIDIFIEQASLYQNIISLISVE